MILRYGRGADRRREYGPKLDSLLPLASSDLRLPESDTRILENALAEVDTSEADELDASAMKACILIRLGNSEVADDEYEEGIERLTKALDAAIKSRDESLMHRSLMSLGEAHRKLENWDTSVSFFQQSLAYCRVHWPVGLFDSLGRMADTLAISGKCWREARFSYQQLVSIHPHNLSYRARYFQATLRTEYASEVIQARRLREWDDFESIADTVAACAASHQFARAGKIAEAGLVRARENGDSDWAEEFETAANLSRGRWLTAYLFREVS
jgi:tetratricopeptide (TPR) repeat protein